MRRWVYEPRLRRFTFTVVPGTARVARLYTHEGDLALLEDVPCRGAFARHSAVDHDTVDVPQVPAHLSRLTSTEQPPAALHPVRVFRLVRGASEQHPEPVQ